MTTGERIRQIRLENKMTQKQVAEACGMADSAIRKYESGKIVPKPETLQRIADALNVSVYMLLSDSEKELYLQAESSLVRANLKAGYQFTSDEKLLVRLFHKLNETGKDAAIDRVEELTEIPRYRLQDAPEAPVPTSGHGDTTVATFCNEDALCSTETVDTTVDCKDTDSVSTTEAHPDAPDAPVATCGNEDTPTPPDAAEVPQKPEETEDGK